MRSGPCWTRQTRAELRASMSSHTGLLLLWKGTCLTSQNAVRFQAQYAEGTISPSAMPAINEKDTKETLDLRLSPQGNESTSLLFYIRGEAPYAHISTSPRSVTCRLQLSTSICFSTLAIAPARRSDIPLKRSNIALINFLHIVLSKVLGVNSQWSSHMLNLRAIPGERVYRKNWRLGP